MTSRRVAVVGGGMAGLAAAWRAASLGADVVIYEAAERPGGAVRSVVRDGWIAEAGPHLIAAADPLIQALLGAAAFAQVGVRPGPNVRRNYVLHGGQVVPLPVSVAELSSTPLLSLGGRLRFARDLVMAAGAPSAEETVDAFARRRFGDEVAERLFDPRVTSTICGDPRAVLAADAFPVETGFERSHGSVLRGSIAGRMAARRRARTPLAGSWGCIGGLTQLAEQLAAQGGATVHTGTAVERVACMTDGVAIEFASGARNMFDAVILALPAVATGHVMRDGGPAAAAIAEMPHASVAVVSLGFARDQVDHPLDGYRLIVPSSAQRDLLSVVFASSILPARAPDGHVLLTMTVGGALRPDLAEAAADRLVPLMLAELRTLLGVRGQPVFSEISHWPRALPQPVAGHAARLAAADQLECSSGGLALTGSWRDGSAISNVLLGGIRAADRIAERQGWNRSTSPER
jgi:oxygen-dependent protoporphyrinogen oxidase